MSSFHPVGFSLGGQVVGHLGYKMDGKLHRITGLDPAGKLFEKLFHCIFLFNLSTSLSQYSLNRLIHIPSFDEAKEYAIGMARNI